MPKRRWPELCLLEKRASEPACVCSDQSFLNSATAVACAPSQLLRDDHRGFGLHWCCCCVLIMFDDVLFVVKDYFIWLKRRIYLLIFCSAQMMMAPAVSSSWYFVAVGVGVRLHDANSSSCSSLIFWLQGFRMRCKIGGRHEF